MKSDCRSGQTHTVIRRISRRTALGCLVGVGVAASVGLEHAQAQGEPNSFVLDGAETRIGYGTTSMRGIPILTYDGPFGDQTFEGDEIRTAESELFGRLVTVLIDQAPDSHTVELTLLLPGFNPMRLGDNPISFATLAILTTHLMTEGGPRLIEGALQEYEAMALEGTARFLIS